MFCSPDCLICVVLASHNFQSLQALAAVAGAAQRQRAAAALDANPLAKKIAQLQQDFDNARKRAADEKSAVTATAVADVASKLLPLLDSFDAAFAAQLQLQQQDQGGAAAREAEQIHTVYTGLHNQLLSILK
jgi:molecular chaperone GrpE (heat shock protein)